MSTDTTRKHGAHLAAGDPPAACLTCTGSLRAQGHGDQRPPQTADETARIAACHDLADELEEEFAQPGLQRPLELVKKKADALGPDMWPQELLTMPAAESEPYFDAMRVCT